MDYAEAFKLAKEYKKINKQLKLDLVGSLARHEQFINDIDFITTLDLPNGKKYYKTKFKDMEVDIWKVEDRKVGKFIRTIDKGHLIGIHKALNNIGYKINPNGIYNKKTNKIIKFSEKKLIEILEKKGGTHEKHTEIQSILFDRNLWTLQDAKDWFYNEGFIMPEGKEVHATKQFWRFRVLQPNKKFIYRIKWLSKKDGIKAVFAILK